jgi:cell division septum initiation protein DivIVA
MCDTVHQSEKGTCNIKLILRSVGMVTVQESDTLAAMLILKQAERVASEVARVAAIVNTALGAAALAMEATGVPGKAEMTEYAKETLQVARSAAAEVLQVAKEEAELTLSLARSLASAWRAEQEAARWAVTSPVLYSI